MLEKKTDQQYDFRYFISFNLKVEESGGMEVSQIHNEPHPQSYPFSFKYITVVTLLRTHSQSNLQEKQISYFL